MRADSPSDVKIHVVTDAHEPGSPGGERPRWLGQGCDGHEINDDGPSGGTDGVASASGRVADALFDPVQAGVAHEGPTGAA